MTLSYRFLLDLPTIMALTSLEDLSRTSKESGDISYISNRANSSWLNFKDSHQSKCNVLHHKVTYYYIIISHRMF